MATTVAQHQVGTITDPADGSAMSASVMRGVSATLRTEINAHDADPGLHLQSSVASSRPAAGTAGRKWLDTDTKLVKYDNGTSWDDLAYLKSSGGTLTGAVTVTGATVTMAASVSGHASLNLPEGSAPSSPANGDLWLTTAGLYVQAAGTTVGPLRGGLYPHCHVSQDGNQTISNSASAELTFNTEREDASAMHSGGTVTIPANAGGVYAVCLVPRLASGAVWPADVTLALRVNGTAVGPGYGYAFSPTGAGTPTLALTLALAAADAVTWRLSNSSGGSVVLNGSILTVTRVA